MLIDFHEQIVPLLTRIAVSLERIAQDSPPLKREWPAADPTVRPVVLTAFADALSRDEALGNAVRAKREAGFDVHLASTDTPTGPRHVATITRGPHVWHSRDFDDATKAISDVLALVDAAQRAEAPNPESDSTLLAVSFEATKRESDAATILAADVKDMRAGLVAIEPDEDDATRAQARLALTLEQAGMPKDDAWALAALSDDALDPKISMAVKAVGVARLGEAGFATACASLGIVRGRCPSASMLRRFVLEHMAKASAVS